MKTFMLIMLALFSFESGERYIVSDYTCENNQLKVEYDHTWYDVSIFNVLIKEDTNICEYIDGDISIEIDPYVKVESPLNAYVFIDNTLLQQTLVDEKKATIKIENPRYKYPLENKSEEVMQEVETQEETHHGFTTSKLIALALIAIWGLLGILILCIRMKGKRKR